MSSPASGPVPVPVSGSASTSTGGVLVLTQVIPSQPHCSPQRACVGTQSFIRGHPLAVGTVQIMIGVMALLFGIVMAIGADSLGVFSGIFVWGSGFYITAGSLTVAAGKSPSRCLVNTSLAFNVVASVVSMTALILYCMDAAGIMFYCWTSDYSSRWICDHYRVRMQGFSGVLAVFHLLEFIVTITVAGFACKATCPCCNEQQQQQPVYVIPGNTTLAAQAPPTSHVQPVTMVHPAPQVVVSPKPEGYINHGLTEPPAYTLS